MPYTGTQKRDYQRLWVAANRARFFAGKTCVECGSTQNLELDHIDPAKKVSHSIWSWSQKRRDEEIAKCQVLCKSCHQKKTARQRLERIPLHGNRTRYAHGCRCDECREANAAYQRKRRAAIAQ